MREIKLPYSEAKQRLFDAAELLFAERGFDAVSVRDITHLANANVAAINYHFGTRDGLIALVVTRYLTPVNDERLARLENLDRRGSGKAVPVEEALDALVRPLLGAVRTSKLSEELLCRLLGRIFAMRGEDLPLGIENQARHVNDRFTRVLGKSLTALSPEELAWRSHMMVGAMIHMLMHQDMLQRLTHGASGSLTMEASLSHFIRFAAAGLRDGVDLEPAVKKEPQALFDF